MRTPLPARSARGEHSANQSHPKAGDMVWAVPRRAADDNHLVLFGRLDPAADPDHLRPVPTRRVRRPAAPRLLEGGRDHTARVRSAKAKALT
jgi:hypothetical protein